MSDTTVQRGHSEEGGRPSTRDRWPPCSDITESGPWAPAKSLAVFGVLSGVLFIALAVAVALKLPEVAAFDAALQSLVFPLRNEGLTSVIAALTDLSDVGCSLLIAIATMVYLAVNRGRRAAFVYMACIAGGETLVALIKVLEARVRPLGMNVIDFPSDASFPSGHVFASIAIVTFTLIIIVRLHPTMVRGVRGTLMALAVLWSLFIAFTRIYLGVHWPTDVLGSFLLGAGVYLPAALGLWHVLVEKLSAPEPERSTA